MSLPRNPFTTLYVTEHLNVSDFPILFSPQLLRFSTPMFESGNVVLQGTQGAGKSMLLNLLRTEVRLAYEQINDVQYPVGIELRRFLSAGINLATNQALRSAGRWSGDLHGRENELRLCFIDYVNCWILRDLLRSIKGMMESRSWRTLEIGGEVEEFLACLPEIVRAIPFLVDIGRSLQSIDSVITERITTYLRFFNGRPKDLPKGILETQSDSLGQPISDFVEVLKSNGFLGQSTKIFIIIDQFEQLLEMEASLPGRPFFLLRDTIDQAIHRREPSISFRVGTRPYAWHCRTGEAIRDYFTLNLDEILRQKEHGNKSLFKDLASDVFKRRLRAYGYEKIAEASDPLSAALDSSPTPDDRARLLGTNVDWSKRISIPKDVKSTVADGLRELGKREPLDAKLGVAWASQNREFDWNQCIDGVYKESLPWNSPEKRWWRKERCWIALLQLAADNRQKVVMFGKQDIIKLSGENILVFSSLCQHIWDVWIRTINEGDEAVWQDQLPVSRTLQNEGVINASYTWHEKIKQESWVGDTLVQFVDVVAGKLSEHLKADSSMSYPGANGISIANSDLVSHPDLRKLLDEAAGRGFVVRRDHTPKTRSRGPSTKWYLHQILAPYYGLTLVRTKEPLYVTCDEISKWMGGGDSKRAKISHSQPALPGMNEEDEER